MFSSFDPCDILDDYAWRLRVEARIDIGMDILLEMSPREAQQILGVKPNSPKEDIEKAWKRLIVKHHPDRGGSVEMAQKINAAHDVLKGAPRGFRVPPRRSQQQQQQQRQKRPHRQQHTDTTESVWIFVVWHTHDTQSQDHKSLRRYITKHKGTILIKNKSGGQGWYAGAIPLEGVPNKYTIEKEIQNFDKGDVNRLATIGVNKDYFGNRTGMPHGFENLDSDQQDLFKDAIYKAKGKL